TVPAAAPTAARAPGRTHAAPAACTSAPPSATAACVELTRAAESAPAIPKDLSADVTTRKAELSALLSTRTGMLTALSSCVFRHRESTADALVVSASALTFTSTLS